MKSNEIISNILLLTLLASSTVFGISPSSALGSCPFGYEATDFDEDAEPICEKYLWYVTDEDDGFDRIVAAQISVDNSDINVSDYGFTLVVRCTSKKLEVYANSDGYEMFYKSAYNSGGNIKVKFDSGTVKNYRFTKSTDNKAFFISSPKTFATSLSKAKRSVSLKLSSSRGNVTLQFPTSDFAKHKKTFISGGCTF